jgi:tetratricopeptide (TPR) repeat protein
LNKRQRKKMKTNASRGSIKPRGYPGAHSGDPLAELVSLGRDRFMKGEFKEALSLWRRSDPETRLEEVRSFMAEVCFRLAQEQRLHGRYQAAMSYLTEASSLWPSRASYPYHLGLEFHRSGNLKRAEAEYQRVLGLEPNHDRALFHLALARMERAMAKNSDRAGGAGALAEFVDWLDGPQGRLLKPQEREFFAHIMALIEGRPLPPLAEGYEPLQGTLVLRGLKRHSDGDPQGAIGYYDRAARSAEPNPCISLYRALAGICLDHPGVPLESLKDCEAVYGRYPEIGGEVLAILKAAMAEAASTQDYDRIIDILERDAQTTRSLDPSGILRGQALLARGYRYVPAQRWQEVIEDWEKALEFDEDNPTILRNLALAHEKAGDDERAIVYWREAIKSLQSRFKRNQAEGVSAKHLALARRRLGWLLLEEGRFLDGVSEMEAAIRHDPGNLSLRLELAEALLAGDEEARAEPHIKVILESSSGDLEVLKEATRVLVAAERLDEAIKVLRRVLVLEPENEGAGRSLTHVLSRRGRRHVRQKDYEGAVKDLQEALGRDPGDPFTLSSLAVMAHRQGKKTEAERWLKRALSARAGDAETYICVASAYSEMKRPQLSSQHIRKALASGPPTLSILMTGGRLHLANGHGRLAEQCFDQLLELYPLDEYVYLDIFHMCCDRGECRLARKYLDMTMRAFPRNPHILPLIAICLLGRCNEKSGRS